MLTTCLLLPWSVDSADSASGQAVTAWTPGATYTCQVAGATFRGILAAPLQGADAEDFTGSRSGSFQASSDANMRNMDNCNGGVTSASATRKTAASFSFIAPAAGSGTVTLWAIIVLSERGNNYWAKQNFPELGAPLPSASVSNTPSPSPSASPSTGSSGEIPTPLSTSSPQPPHASPSRVPTASSSPTPSYTNSSGVGGAAGSIVFTASTMLGSNMALAWQADTDAGILHMQLAFLVPSEADQTWFGIAFNDGPDMVGGDSIAVEPGKPVGQQVNRYALNGYTMRTCPQIADATLLPQYSSLSTHTGPVIRAAAADGAATAPTALDLLSNSGSVSASSFTTVATFSRKMAPSGGVGSGSRVVDPTSDVYLTWAWGPSGVTRISSHTAETSGATKLNLATGITAGNAASPTWWILFIHALLMVLGLSIVMPTAVLVRWYGPTGASNELPDEHEQPARSKQSIDLQGPYQWRRRAQRQATWLAIALIAAGTGVGVWMTSTRGTGRQLGSTHSQIGVALVAVAASIALACLLPYPSLPNQPSYRSWVYQAFYSIVGHLISIMRIGLVIAAPIAAIFGIKAAGISSGWYAIIALMLLLPVLIVVVAHIAGSAPSLDAKGRYRTEGASTTSDLTTGPKFTVVPIQRQPRIDDNAKASANAEAFAPAVPVQLPLAIKRIQRPLPVTRSPQPRTISAAAGRAVVM